MPTYLCKFETKKNRMQASYFQIPVKTLII
jgi:hypothetical protein